MNDDRFWLFYFSCKACKVLTDFFYTTEALMSFLAESCFLSIFFNAGASSLGGCSF
jgi:hypothetical protein